MRHLLVIVLLLLPTTVWAQTPEEVTRAEEYYQAAMAAFQAGDFSKAAEQFQLSYDLVPKPELLYNASFALARSGELDAAQKIARDAVATELPADIDAKFRARLHAWRTAEQAQLPREPTPSVVNPEPAEPEPVAVVERPAPGPSSRLRVASYLTGGLGLTALLTAGVMELQLRAVERELDDAAAQNDGAAYDASLQRGQRLQNFGRVSIIAGGALIATSVVLWVISRKKRRDTGPAVVFRF